ncbi:hypothetical protein F8M41_006913 [Gigaspora margarita]|uniref:Uncharacterized protein n=1 Tax=Gigaspora margarita TaxID=4874 RepID=A0A8H4A5P1_GIGMA|nr:hypothetical protein F8M41_006913 [Gigaspora margarita]
MSDYEESHLDRRSNKNYVKTQLNAYISKLKSTKKYEIVEPISIDRAEWLAYIRSSKELSEKLKSDAEFAYVGALFKHIKANLEDSIVETSNTQMNQVKQAYNYIHCLISKFEDQKILMTKWNPLLNKVGITFQLLYCSNSIRKTNFILYDEFINQFINECNR